MAPVARLRGILAGIAPAVVAGFIVLMEPHLTEWLHGREAVLPVAMMIVLCAMLMPLLRQYLVVTLCYGVAFLALRDAQRVQPLPSFVNYDLIVEARPAALYTISAFAAFAAVLETATPGTIWARRCYFGAAAVYFTGLGVISCGWRVTWQALMLVGTGASAMIAFIFAHRIATDDELEEEVEEEPDDEAVQREREARHAAALRTKEWDDVGASLAPAQSRPQVRRSIDAPALWTLRL